MLLQISIRNFAIFHDAVLEPENGLNIITGESGAGKSVIVNALSLICGARAYKEMIRTGEESASVEAVFKIPENKKEILREKFDIDDDILVITREINKDKSSICKINGRIRNLSLITEAASILIDIHGQYENQTLLDVENHIKYLDEFAYSDINPTIINYNKIQKEYSDLINSLLSAAGGENERERNKQILEFQIEEIESAGLERLDEDSIRDKQRLLENSENFKNSTGMAINFLENENFSISESLRSAVKELEILPSNENIKSLINNLNDSYFQIKDTTTDLIRFNESIEFNEVEYEELMDLNEKINVLKRKYGTSISDILEFRNNAQISLNNILNFKRDYSKKLDKLKEYEKDLFKLDEELSDAREKSAVILKSLLLKELYDMGMKDSAINIEFSKPMNKNMLGFTDFPLRGRDKCEFLISLNKGLDPVTLGKVASGGEMSRIMLSFKSVFSYKDDTQTVVFDEIDAGISGEASIAVAEKLDKLSKDKQILCITHLPQIAARGKSHFVIKKNSDNKKTTASVEKVSNIDERIDVIAALTDGTKITSKGREHAAEILMKNKNYF